MSVSHVVTRRAARWCVADKEVPHVRAGDARARVRRRRGGGAGAARARRAGAGAGAALTRHGGVRRLRAVTHPPPPPPPLAPATVN